MRYLVVLDHTLGGTALTATLASHAASEAEIHVLVPCVEPGEGQLDTDDNLRDETAARLETELQRLRDAGIQATGAVGVADPMQAIRDALATDTYTGVIIATQPLGLSRWLHLDLPHRVEHEFQLVVEVIEAHTDDPAEPTSVTADIPRIAMRNLEPHSDPKRGIVN
jgi:hypothetical protein